MNNTQNIWKYIYLKDLERKGGGTPSTQKKEYWGGKIFWITSANIDESGRIHYDKTITEEGLKNSSSNLIPKNSVIMVTRVGLGKIAVNDRDVAINQDCQGIICKDIDPFYLMWQLRSVANEIISKGQGTTISGITISKLNTIKIKVPSSIEQQREIVKEIEFRMSIIEKVEQNINLAKIKADLFKKALLKSAFSGKIVKSDNLD